MRPSFPKESNVQHKTTLVQTKPKRKMPLFFSSLFAIFAKKQDLKFFGGKQVTPFLEQSQKLGATYVFWFSLQSDFLKQTNLFCCCTSMRSPAFLESFHKKTLLSNKGVVSQT